MAAELRGRHDDVGLRQLVEVSRRHHAQARLLRDIATATHSVVSTLHAIAESNQRRRRFAGLPPPEPGSPLAMIAASEARWVEEALAAAVGVGVLDELADAQDVLAEEAFMRELEERRRCG